MPLWICLNISIFTNYVNWIFFLLKLNIFLQYWIAGKNLKHDELLISPELQDIIDMIFGGEIDGNPNANSDEEEAANEESSIVASSKFIQLSSIKTDVESTSADCYYPNNGNSVVFRETTV